MKLVLIAATAVLSLSTQTMGDTFNDGRHEVTGPVAACLSAPTRVCALQAAMTTAIEEKLSIERAKVLTAIGRAMAETGSKDDARLTLNMALEEAKNSKISFAVDAKVMEMAPVYALLGDVDKAIELINALQTPNVRNRVLSRAADLVAEGGNVAAARKLSEALDSRHRAVWVSLSAMKLLVFGGYKEGLSDYADSIMPTVEMMKRPSDRLLGMVRLSMVYAAVGDYEKSKMLQEKSDEIRNSFVSYTMKARLASAQLEYASVIEDVNEKEQAIATALAAENRIRGPIEKSSIIDELGPALAFAGHVAHAAGYAKYFKEILEKSNYLKKVSKFAGAVTNVALSNVIRGVLVESQAIENGFEADEVRMNLLFAARSTADLELSKEIALAMQDDDNAARALALLIPLL